MLLSVVIDANMKVVFTGIFVYIMFVEVNKSSTIMYVHKEMCSKGKERAVALKVLTTK